VILLFARIVYVTGPGGLNHTTIFPLTARHAETTLLFGNLILKDQFLDVRMMDAIGSGVPTNPGQYCFHVLTVILSNGGLQISEHPTSDYVMKVY
jgi:hypothetical protein